jgi:WD40 repeat protein/DNA-binding SARP family transcriptional activator/class 3 adenylate cyclase
MDLPEDRGRAAVRDADQTSALMRAAEEIRTFLVADVRGYTAFTQEHGDEAAAGLVAKFAAVVHEYVEARDGSVIELRGDEALAAFRSPRQAIRAAVDLQRRFLEETLTAPDLPLPVGIGLDAGEAVPVGGGYRGGALNLAARLCGEAGPGDTLGSQGLVHLARTVEGVRYIDRGQTHLKGLSDPVHVLAIAAEEADIPEQMRARVSGSRGRRVYGGKLHFRVLGPLEVDAGSGPIALGGPKQRAVLARLLIRPNELVAADALVDEVWGDDPPEKARNVIQTYVSHLRKALGHDRIQSHAPGYRLRVEPSELDAARFDGLLRDAKKALPLDPNIAVGLLDDALSLWRGPALADVAEQPSLLAEAARLEDSRLQAQEDRIEALLESGAQARAIGELEVLVGRHRFREKLWMLLMLALYRDGRQAEALHAYRRAREILVEELGIDPSPELARLHERVLKQDPTLDLRGEPLRGYRLLEKIGEGRTGVVFRAIQPHVGRDVAVKLFQEQVAADAAFVRRFEPEGQAAAGLEHPHIAPIHDYWREPGRAYVVSRYFRGGSLRGLEDRGGPLGRDSALRMVEQIASALAFAHRQGVTHGHVGPSNVLFDAEGNAYLGDFRIGVGPRADAADDLRGLAGIVKRYVPRTTALAELAEQAQVGTDELDADAFADAARRRLEPAAVARLPAAVERNPYKGLRPFTEADARDFFGRGELIHRLIARLNEPGAGSRFVAVVGPSGAGKSSVVRAGIVPAVRRGALGDAETTFVAEMFPGSHPLEELEAALLRIAVRPASRLHGLLDAGSRGLLEAVDLIAPGEAEIVLIVDQFEEVFTLTTDERERELFLESLRVATADPDSRLRVIVTLRADFYDRPLVYPRFGELLAARTEAVPPLTPDELEQAIRGPAEQVGVRPERGLVAEMIADVAHQPGALPLLQFALTELFERQDDGRLTLSAYQVLGGVAGALSARADRIYEATDPEGRRAIRQVFLRLVTLGEGREDTRRRVARSELASLEVEQEAIEGVLDAFGRHRLLTFDREQSTREPTVEIAHEALLTAWVRLRTWIDAARDDLRQQRVLAQAAAEWRGSDGDASFLLRGTRLEQLEQWAASTDLALGGADRAYLRASLDRRERERTDEEARREREARMERRSRTRLRALVVVLAVGALVAGLLTLFATRQSGRANREARIASARELAAAAVSNLEVDPERSVLLVMAAIDKTRSADGTVVPEAVEALHRAVTSSRVVMSAPALGGRLDWSPAGVFVTEGPEGTGLVDIRDAETGERVFSFKGHDGDVTDVAFSRDGSKLATTGEDGLLKVWEPSTGELLASLAGEGIVAGPSFSADGSLVAAAWSGQKPAVRVLDLRADRVVWKRDLPDAADTALSPEGDRIAVTAIDRETAVFDLATDEREFGLKGFYSENPRIPGQVAWSPDGRYIATTSSAAPARIYAASTGRRLSILPDDSTYDMSLAWSPRSPSQGSGRLAIGGSKGTAYVWDVRGRHVKPVESLSAPELHEGVTGVAFSPNGSRVMAGDFAFSAVKMWDLGPNGDAEWGNLPGGGDPPEFSSGSLVAFTSAGRRLVATTPDSTALTVWDVQARHRVLTIDPATIGYIAAIDVSPDGRVIAAGGWGVSRLGGEVAGAWDAATGRELFRVGHRSDVLDVAFSPDGDMASAGWAGAVKIVDADGRLIRVVEEDDRFKVEQVRFSSDGRLLATAAMPWERGDPRVRVWDWKRGALLRTIPSAFSVDFDPTGPRMVTASERGAEIWDLDGFKLLAGLVGAHREIGQVAFSADGSLIATGHDDGTVQLFDAATGRQELVLPANACRAPRLAFSPDGTKLASANPCGGVRIWALDIGDLLQIARQNVTRSLTDEECRQYLHVDRCPQA